MIPSLDGVRLLETPRHEDEGGWFLPAFAERFHREHGIDHAWAEMNISHTHPGVIRGLHFQQPQAQSKIISVLEGAVWDVVVDLRPGSPTFRQWESYDLSAEGVSQIYLPAGLAHGLATPHGPATIAYLVGAAYAPDHEHVLAWDDPELAIPWPVKDPVLSPRDREGRTLAALLKEGTIPAPSFS